MNVSEHLAEISRLLRNLIRIGTVTAVDLDGGLCRVQTGADETDWLSWLNSSAERVKRWHAPSEVEQVLILSLGGELDSAFVLPGIFPMTTRHPQPQRTPFTSAPLTAR